MVFKSKIAKKTTLLILFLISVSGIIGCFMGDKFNMENYLNFLNCLLKFYIPVVVSVGYSSAKKKDNLEILSKDKQEEK